LDEEGFEFTMELVERKYNKLENINEIKYIFESWRGVVDYLINNFEKYSKEILKKWV
jgi:hypothetical protein